MSNMILGLRTTIYKVESIDEAKKWYAAVLGFNPYFDQPYYVGFNVGGYELGLQPVENPNLARGENVVAYWGVENIETAAAVFLKHGAQKHEEIQDVGEGIFVASFFDPFGNVIGIIQNPEFSL